MSDPFRHVKPGDRKISATAWNRMLDAIRPVPAAVGGGPLGSERRIGLVTVKNVDATDYDRFDVLAVSDILISPTDNEPEFLSRVALKVTLPTWPDDAGRFVILAEPLAAGEIGRAWASGVCQAWIDVTDEGHRFADIDDGSSVLVSRGTGAALILWKESGTGTKWAIVRLVAPAAEAGIAQRYGKVVTPGVATPTEGWNEVTLAPCSRAGVDSGEANVTAYCLSGVTVRPNLETGEVVGYVDDGTDCVVNLVKSEAYYGSDP